MTIRVFSDIEEAIAREGRRITFFENRSVSHTVLKDTFDPVTGEMVSLPIEPDFYDSSVNSKNIQYPHFFIKLLRTREDRFTGRVVPQYGKPVSCPVTTSSKAYEIVLYGHDGTITSAGNIFTTGIFSFRKAQVGQLLRIYTGPNKGTYKITVLTPSLVGTHTITVSADLISNLPVSSFNLTDRVLTFLDYVDLNTIKVGDNFVDSLSVSWPITAINITDRTLTLGGVGTPSVLINSKVTRSPNVFSSEVGPIKYSILDPTKPVEKNGSQSYTSNSYKDYSIPLDLYYLLRIDSKEKQTHTQIANRMWEEFNPPRTALPVIVRTKDSAESELAADVTLGGSTTLNITSNSGFKVGDYIHVFDDLTPTKKQNGEGFQTVFKAKIISKVGTTQLILDISVPDSFKVENRTKIVSNAESVLYAFHFVDHITKDVESAQYWCHEFTFWVQAWIDRQGEATVIDDVVQDYGITLEDTSGNVIIEC